MSKDEVLWPNSDDDLQVSEDAKDLITGLLKKNPLQRTGAGGAQEIKIHSFFLYLNWDNLLRNKAEFVPQLDGPDDTSYFDTRAERYNVIFARFLPNGLFHVKRFNVV